MSYKFRWVFLFSGLFLSYALLATGEKVSTIVIDAGHGGKDAGAVGKVSYEKNIALAVALKFGKLINENLPDVKVVYTRKDDRSVELRKRAQIANNNHADLFVSIHCNSVDNKTAKGTETWIMGNHKNETNLKVAQLENSVILKEQNYEENYDNFNPNSPEAYIIFSLYQNAFMDQSLNFASRIQTQYTSANTASPNRGIKQAGFIVLWACALPAVLTEIGFISNPEEEKFLNSEEGQNKIAVALLNAFKEYKYQVEGFNNQITHVEKPTNQANSQTGSQASSQSNSQTGSQTSSQTSSPTTVKIAESMPPENISDKKIDKSAEKTKTSENNLVFKIQIATSSSDKDLRSAEFAKFPKPSKYVENGLYKFCCGEASSMEEAQLILEQVHNAGYRDAFTIVFCNGKKISTQEANRILLEQNK